MRASLDHSYYGAWPLVGATLSFTVDISQAGCGCNVAAYLVSMAQSTQPGICGGDYYCDANAVCDVRCDEIDLLEANTNAIHATAHHADDGDGNGAGLGGMGVQEVMSSADYGRGGGKIDTSHPFRVSVSFYGGPQGQLTRIGVKLTQGILREITFQMADDGYARQPFFLVISLSLHV